MAYVLRSRKRRAGDPADADQEARLRDVNQALDEGAAGGDLSLRRPAVGERLGREMGMGGDGVPQDDASLRVEFFEDAVHDGAGRLLPRSGSPARAAVGSTPAQKVELAGERDARPAHALVAGSLTDRDHVRFEAFIEVGAEVGEPDRGGIRQVIRPGVPELVEGRADVRGGQIRKQGVDRGLVRIGQWS